MRLARYTAALIISLALSLPNSASRSAEPPGGAIDPKLVLEQFEVGRDPYLLLLPVEIKGKKYPFMVATGVRFTMYDLSLRPLLGPPIENGPSGASDGDGIRVMASWAPDARVGKLKLPADRPVPVMDLAKYRGISDSVFYGILGMDFLRQYILYYDPDAGKLLFLSKAGKGAGRAVRLTFSKHGWPQVEAHLAGQAGTVQFVIDTASGGYLSVRLAEDVFTELQKNRTLRVVTTGAGGTGVSDVPVRQGRLEGLSLGGLTNRGLLADSGKRSVLALGFLSRYAVTFDFPHNTMYLKKGRRFALPDNPERSGLDLVRVASRIEVDSVAKGSPAAKAGIQPGDVLLQVEDMKGEQLRMATLYRTLSTKGKTLSLRVRRGEKELAFSLKLGDWPEEGKSDE